MECNDKGKEIDIKIESFDDIIEIEEFDLEITLSQMKNNKKCN